MKSSRKLGLRREVLADLDVADLRAFAGGVPPTTRCDLTLNTCFSCLTYISCNPLACVVRDLTEDVTTIQSR